MTATIDTWWRMLHETHQSAQFGLERCRALAASGRVGRLISTGPDGPHIVLTVYVWAHDRIYLPAALAERLRDVLDGRTVSFEIDEFECGDGASARGWSVVADGTARVVPAMSAWAELAGVLGPDGFPGHWPPGDVEEPLMCIDVESLTGHQVRGAW